MSLSVESNVNSTGYEDIDNLNNQQNDLWQKAYQEQQNMINTGVNQNIADIERNKDKLQEETTKTNKALYADYQKQVNPYGVAAESLAENGLAGSGVAETTKTNLYNTYQKNRTETLNTARNLLADYNNEITKAKQNGDMQMAQAAYNMYTQQINNLYQTYQLVQNAKQFAYQQERDKVSDNQWQQEFDYNKSIDERNYNYQLNRDAVADSQWEKEYALSKKASSSSSRSSGGINGNVINVNDDSIDNDNTPTANNADEIITGFTNSINTAKNILNTSQNEENKARAKALIENIKTAIINQQDKGVLTASQADGLYAKIGY